MTGPKIYIDCECFKLYKKYIHVLGILFSLQTFNLGTLVKPVYLNGLLPLRGL